jgi:hypothetical protein
LYPAASDFFLLCSSFNALTRALRRINVCIHGDCGRIKSETVKLNHSECQKSKIMIFSSTVYSVAVLQCPWALDADVPGFPSHQAQAPT